MSTWGAMVQRIGDETGRSTDADAVKKAIVSSIRFYRNKRFWFNEQRSTTFTTCVVGQYEYAATTDYPAPLIEIDSLQIVKSTNAIYPMLRVTLARMREMHGSDNLQGVPQWWTWHHKKFIIHPTPNSAYVIRGDYLQDIGTPSYTWNGSAWAFLGENAVAITDAYTNDWFTTAEEVIRHRAKGILFAEYLGNSQRASESYASSDIEYQNLLDRAEQYSVTSTVLPWYG